MARYPLCRPEEIPDGTARGFVVGSGESRADLFVFRRGIFLRAYRNRCPHQGTPLEMVEDRFMANDGEHFLCTTHGARFRVEDGYCSFGPCKKQSLTPLPLKLEAGMVCVEV